MISQLQKLPFMFYRNTRFGLFRITSRLQEQWQPQIAKLCVFQAVRMLNYFIINQQMHHSDFYFLNRQDEDINEGYYSEVQEQPQVFFFADNHQEQNNFQSGLQLYSQPAVDEEPIDEAFLANFHGTNCKSTNPLGSNSMKSQDFLKQIDQMIKQSKPKQPQDQPQDKPFFEILQKEAQNCTICYELMSEYQRLNRLKCKHVFHSQCLRQWKNNSNCCPLCRAYTG